MRVSRSFSFDADKDKELLTFLDGCRNASDSVRGILRNALGLMEEQSAYKEIAATIKPIASAYQEIATTIEPSYIQTGSKEPPQSNSESDTEIKTEINTEIATDIQKAPVKVKLTGFDNVLAVMNRK